ncbi:wobble nucleotide-excising tRNase [Albidovulum inexpectatum]|uniref:Wobble nucleotide-excising tRNase n=1 Tax=Albidovulum inexpectatum TaxID=196587 RepID=A0A2S5JEQ4_9RHOB|nr:wobble nucleotide-excising tRNase [Albidovulum inexpectatum]
MWKDFSSSADLLLAPRTLIYGFNGSGKTTLSRVFSSIERESLEERLPSETTFKIELSDGSTITHDPISNPFGRNLLVFNTDFVSRNFKWDAGSTKAIAYLSEKKIDARREFDEVAEKLEHAKQKAKTKKDEKEKADKALKDFKTRVARNIREVASSSTYTQSYDARKIEGHYSKASFGKENILSEEDLKKYQVVLAQREPLPTLSFSPSLPTGLIDWFKDGLALLTQSVSGIALKEFEAHTDALRWVEEGLHFHDEHSVSDCLLCGNPFSEERRAQLRDLFDKSWTEALRALEDAVKHGQEHQQALRELYRTIPKEAEVTADERKAFSQNRALFETAIKQLGVCVGELLKGLEVRAANPIKEIVVTGELADFDLEEWLAEYGTIEAALNATVKKHNDASTNFAAMQKEAFEKIEAHVLATNQSDWNHLQKDVQEAEAALEVARDDEKNLSDRQLQLRNELQDHGVGADKMNELIWAYLGHKELRLVANDAGGYRILRPSGKPATELSEGERTAVSFCYFLTQLEAEGRKLNDLVLVIDDPISSLDTAARTHAYSLMTRMTKKCAQVIVLTHNTSFMNMVKREFQNLQKRNPENKVTALLSLDCRNSGNGEERVTSLIPMHKLLEKYDSEYHYLFSLVMDAAEKQSTDYLFLLPNATRKLLERLCQRNGACRGGGRRVASGDGQAIPVQVLQDQPRDHPLGGDAVRSLPAFAAQRRGPAS